MPFHYAIGDVHGRFDLLDVAVKEISQDLQRRRESGKLVMLGDYIDRGPDSRGVVTFLSDNPGMVCLKGNHEAMMVSALRGDPVAERLWLSSGGKETLRSFSSDGRVDIFSVPAFYSMWADRLPTYYQDDHRVYVHAGLEPGTLLSKHRGETMLWIRESFLYANATDFPDGKHIVHGHTPRWQGKPSIDKAELLSHRTNIDTGAYMTGVLTAAEFNDHIAGGPTRILQITRAGARWFSV